MKKPVISDAETKNSRTFSKRATILVILLYTLIVLVGMQFVVPDLANVIAVAGAFLGFFLTAYMHVGHSDYRVSKGLPGLIDAVAGLVGRKGPPNV